MYNMETLFDHRPLPQVCLSEYHYYIWHGCPRPGTPVIWRVHASIRHVPTDSRSP